MVFQTDALRSNKEHVFLKFQPARLMYTFLTSSKDRFQINIRVISFFFAWVHSDYDRNIYILQKTFEQVFFVLTYLCIAKKIIPILHDKHITATTKRNKLCLLWTLIVEWPVAVCNWFVGVDGHLFDTPCHKPIIN